MDLASTINSPALVVRPAQGGFEATKDDDCIKLEHVYFGCTTVNLYALIGMPLPCSLNMTADDRAGDVLKSQNIEYSPKFENKECLVSKMSSAPVDLPHASRVSALVTHYLSTTINRSVYVDCCRKSCLHTYETQMITSGPSRQQFCSMTSNTRCMTLLKNVNTKNVLPHLVRPISCMVSLLSQCLELSLIRT